MPAKANAAPAATQKKYNPTVTAFFNAPKFGMKNEEGDPVEGTAFISADIDAKAFDVIQKHVSIGTKLLLRQAQRLNKSGGKTYYLEVLPPLADNVGYRGNSRANNDI